MGIDAEFQARPFVEVSDEQFETLRARLHERFPDELACDAYRFPDIFWDEYETTTEPTLMVRCHHRYYGPGYERGHWPDIKILGDWLATELGELAELRYGQDCDDHWDRLVQWGKVRDELQRHWDEHGNERTTPVR